ncbi:MAG: DUF3160 domain-containing protein [Armatimonadia bacterium]
MRLYLSWLVLALTCSCLSAQERPSTYRSTVTPSVKAHALPVPLSQVRNPIAVQKLTAAQKQRLSQNGFVIIPDNAIQMFYLYEDYGVEGDEAVPNFITVDSLLHAYHLFYDYSLRSVETKYLIPAAVKMTDIGLFDSGKFYKQLPPGPWQDAAALDAAYFTVAKSLLAGKKLPSGLGAATDALVGKELALIAAHDGRALSPLFGTTVHYSQFIARGHYTRSEAMKKYFLAMMWYGQLGFELDEGRDPEIALRHTRQALLITRMISGDDQMRGLWAKIYEPTSFFVGGADDLGYQEYAPIAREVYGAQLPLAAFAVEANLQAFIQRARKVLPQPGIAPYFASADAAGNLDLNSAAVQTRQFRFMGQRFIPDSYILQQLVSPLVKPASPRDARDVPMGLDVMAALGSDRARNLLLVEYNQGRFPNYRKQMVKLRAEFAAKPEREWWQNMYWGWLYAFQALLQDFGQGYPTFMQGAPWQDKELQTSLGSWSQLRHDTLLYAKPSGAEMGGAEPIPVQGYVEPVPEAFGRLAYLTVLSQEGLRRRGVLDKSLDETYGKFKNLLMFLKDCAEKQLANQPLSKDAYERIQYFSGELERLQLSVVKSSDPKMSVEYWGEITNEADRNLSTIADVHTSFGKALEVGVGPAYRIYVIVPRADGKLQIAKGGVFSYHEFLWPVSDRLTDEKWIGMLKSGKAPAQQDWLQSIVVGPKYPREEE